MAETPVTGSGGVFGLGGDRDTEVHVPGGWTVFTSDKNLADAKRLHPEVTWFACFSVRDQSGNYATQPYTVMFDAPPSSGGSHTLYYFDGTALHSIPYTSAANKSGRARVQARIPVGDPPIGMT